MNQVCKPIWLCSSLLVMACVFSNRAQGGDPVVVPPPSEREAPDVLELIDGAAVPLSDAPDFTPALPVPPDDGAPRGPGSDNCAAAAPAMDGVNFFDTTAATPDGPTHDPGECQYAESTLNNNVWFSYTASCTGTLTVTTCEQAGGSADYDTKLAVYGGTCANLVKLGCNDDDEANACGTGAGGFHSRVVILVTAGQSLLISVGGFGATDVGTGNLFIGCVAATATGACCKPDTTCTDEASPGACATAGGHFIGFGTTCATTTCPCDAVVFQDFSSTGATTIAGNAPGIVTNELGNFIHMGDPVLNRDICEVTVTMQEANATYAATNGTPFDLIVSIWNACPSLGTASGPCGNSGATLLGTVTVPGVTIPANQAANITATFNPPIANVPNDIAVMFRTSRPGPQLQLGGAGPTIGSVPGTPGADGTAIRCGTTLAGQNGCTRNFAGISDVFSFRVAARVTAALGSCCNGETGVCTPGVSLGACLGENQVFTAGGACPGTCHQFMGACCITSSDSCLDSQTIGDCAAAGGNFRGDASSCAAGAQCETVCAPGHEGQALDRDGHGADGVVASVSDSNPELSQATADNFTPAVNGTITHIRWWGYYRLAAAGEPCPVSQGGSSADDWKITLYNDALDLPFQIVVPTFSVTPTKAVTGWQFNGRDYHRFDVTGLNIPVEQDRCYWLEIQNNTTGPCVFFWATGPAGDNKSAGGAETGDYQPGDENDFDMAWCLDIDIRPDGCDSAIELDGACCLDGGATCDDQINPTECLSGGGDFIGFALSCANVDCRGACCIAGSCALALEVDCLDDGGVFQGIGSACTPNPCDGRCCLSDGSCEDNGAGTLSRAECEELAIDGGLGGSFTGGASCAGALCSTFDICDPDGLPALSCGGSLTFNNLAQASEELDGTPPIPDTPDLSCFGGGAADGIGAFWLTFTGTGSEVEISTCGSEVADTVVAVYTNPAKTCNQIDASDEVACNEDDDDGEPDGVFCPGPAQSRLCVPATVLDQTYYVQVTSFDEESVGSITVNMVCPCQVPVTCACPGDTSGDGFLRGDDVQSFANCLITPGAGCDCADSDGDGAADDEFGVGGDIEDFVNKLLTGATCPP